MAAVALVLAWVGLVGVVGAGVSFIPASCGAAAAELQRPAQKASAELPREWRWQKKKVSFDGMYRSRR